MCAGHASGGLLISALYRPAESEEYARRKNTDERNTKNAGNITHSARGSKTDDSALLLWKFKDWNSVFI